jgi:hypothetical protein
MIYENMNKCPIIEFNGPFDPSKSLKIKAKNLRVDKEVLRILDSEYLNATIIKMLENMNKKNKFLIKKKNQLKQELYKKVTKSIKINGLDKQSLLFQFAGEHDRFQVNHSE